MANWKKTLEAVLAGNSDANIAFGDLTVAVQRLGYKMRQRATGHLVFTQPGWPMINLQNANGKAKPYQVAQVREILKARQ